MIQAGRLNERIDIQRPVSVRDAYGDAVPNWSTVAKIWAGAVQGGVREFLAGGSQASERKCLFRVRYPFPNGMMPTSADRIVWRGEVWNINGVSVMRAAGEAQIEAAFVTGSDGR